MQLEMNFGERITEEFQRAKLAELLSKVTPENRTFFARLYPTGVGKDRLTWAITQVNNTIVQNEAVAKKKGWISTEGDGANAFMVADCG